MGLYDRNYMRSPGGSRASDDGMGMLFILLIINVIVFLAANVLPDEVMYHLILTPTGIRHGQIYQLITAGFLHVEFFHLLFNMWGLYIFGGLVAPSLGGKRFLWLYLIGAISGNLLYLLLNWNSQGGLLGASGAVFAVMVAAALIEPNRQFIVFPLPFPMKTRTLVICYTVLEILMLSSGKSDGISHLAHLGGAIGGYLYMKALWGNHLSWDPFLRQAWRPQFRTAPPQPGKKTSGPVGANELDSLLDKVSRHGINSLSGHELARLRQAREEMRGNRQ